MAKSDQPCCRPSEVLQVTAQFRPAVMAKEDAGNMPATANNGSRGTESGDFAQDAIQENRMRKWQQYSSTGSSAKPARQKVRVASLTTTQVEMTLLSKRQLSELLLKSS